jgi:SAM-dependent methyltransferase
MAHPNEREFLRQFLDKAPVADWPADLRQRRVLNVGAAPVEGAIDYGALFPGMSIVGVDQTAGKGVDIVCDLTGPATELGDEQFSAILCCSVLEHCTAPWLAAATLLQHLAPDGLLYITVPWIWRTHNYPADYWRMSHTAIQLLFPGIIWKRMAYATQKPGEILDANQPHDDGHPWRTILGQRVTLVTQFTCAIGRKSTGAAPAAVTP